MSIFTIHSLARARVRLGPILTDQCDKIGAEAAMADVSSLDRSPFGVNCHEASDEMLDELARIRIRWFRFDLEWKKAEPRRGEYDWSTTRRIVEWAKRSGVSLLAVMAYAPEWAWAAKQKVEYKDDTGQIPANSDDWMAFVQAVVGEFGQDIHAYSVWNEPNVHRFWHGDRDEYIKRILQPGIGALRGANPACPIVGPDLASSPKRGEPADWLDDILASGVTFDVLTHHQYDGGNTVLGRMKLLGAIHDVCSARRLGHLPFWVTEIGFKCPSETATRETQASALEDVFREMWARSWWKKTFWYDSHEEGWGLFEGENRVPTFARYGEITSKAEFGKARATRLASLFGRPQPTQDEERLGVASSVSSSRPLVDAALATPEAASLLNRLSPAELALALYQEILGRTRDQVDGDPDGCRATIEAISTGRLAERLVAMLESDEFAAQFADRDR